MKININVKTKVNSQEAINKLKKVLFKSVVKMHQLATNYCPVDKGFLKGSINFYPQSFGALKYSLFAGKDYAPHVEFGTIKMNAQPFLRPAFIQVKNIWVKRFIASEFSKNQNV